MDSTGELPSGYVEIRHVKRQLKMSREDLPWLPEEEHSVHFTKVRLQNGTEFYLGRAIQGKRLVEAAGQLNEHRSRITNNLFFSHPPPFLNGDRSHVKTVDDRVTERPIFCFANPGGQRVYFMQFDKIEGLPVIIRIAVCDKARQDDVMAVISSNSRRVIKARGRL